MTKPKEKKKETEVTLKNIVAFCALMENGEGIIGKSPDYITEKFRRYCASAFHESEEEEYRWGLDGERTLVLDAWCERWLKMEAKK